MNGRLYRIRRFTNGRNKAGDPFVNYSMTIPTVIAEKIPADQKFECVLTEDGILFKPTEDMAEIIELPTWAQENGKAKAKPKAKSTTRKRPSRAKPKDPEPTAA